MRLEHLVRSERSLRAQSTITNWIAAMADGVDAVGILAPVTTRSRAATDCDDHGLELRPADRLFPIPRATGYLRVFLLAPLIVLQSVRLRLFCRRIIVRVPEHGNLMLLPLLALLGFRVTIWMVSDRRASEAAHRRVRPLNLRLRLGLFLSRCTGAVEDVILRRFPVIANGSALARSVRDGLGSARPVLEVVSTTMRTRDLPPVGESVRRAHALWRLLYVGRIAPEKGLRDLIEAVAQLGRAAQPTEFHLDVVGWDAHGEGHRLRALARRLGVDTRVRFHGPQEYGPALFRFFASADIFVLPSHTEGTPRVLVEAMAFGLPIVATNVDGVPNVVTHGTNASLVPPRQPGQMAEAIRDLTRDAKTRQRMRRCNRSRAGEHVVEALSRQMLEFMGATCSMRRAG